MCGTWSADCCMGLSRGSSDHRVVVASAFRRKHSVASTQDVHDTLPFIVRVVASAFRRKHFTAPRRGPHMAPAAVACAWMVEVDCSLVHDLARSARRAETAEGDRRVECRDDWSLVYDCARSAEGGDRGGVDETNLA